MIKAADQAVQEKGQKTRKAILDAAEELFGQGNFDSVSLRDIADKAEVLLGVVGYHFKGKVALFEAVASRRAVESNQIRLKELRSYENPSVEQILDAFIRPILLRKQQPEWRNYMYIVAQISHEERWAGINARLFGKTAREFYQALVKVLPGASPELLARGFIYVVFVFLGTLRENAKLRDLSDNTFDPDDLAKVLDSVVPFVAGGIRALGAMDASGFDSRRPM